MKGILGAINALRDKIEEEFINHNKFSTKRLSDATICKKVADQIPHSRCKRIKSVKRVSDEIDWSLGDRRRYNLTFTADDVNVSFDFFV